MKNSYKSGVSLIAVLMFMLAATTASIVVFRWIALENFSSGARLKASEAYQASQAGLEAVQGWLTNKGADAGALIKIFDDQVAKQPVLMMSNGEDLLGGMHSNRQQNFKVYLIGVNTDTQPYKLKFLSEGTARDGSKHSQVGIFDVEGLYKVTVYKPVDIDAPDIPAFFGGISANTQGRFSSAIINGDLNVNGLSTQGDLIVTGNMSVQDNGERFIGCKSASDNTRTGDMYVFGNTHLRGFTVCGDAYIGGRLETTSNPQFLKSLYAEGGIQSNGLRVYEHVTLGGNLTTNGSLVTFDGNLVIDPQLGNTAQISIVDGSQIRVSGSVWSMSNVFTGNNNNDKYNNVVMGNAGKSLIIPSPSAMNCAISNDAARNCGNNANRWYQLTTGTNYAHFSSQATHQQPSPANKPQGANLLTSMAEQITDCPKPGGGTYKCVPDPLEVPDNTRDIWIAKGKKLDSLVNIKRDTVGLPKACIRLVARPKNANGTGNSINTGYDSHWLFGDGVSGGTCADYPSKGDIGACAGNGGRYNFARAANDCYAALQINDSKNVLYQNGDQGKKFLAIVVNNPEEKSPANGDYFNGNFIFAFEQNPGATIKLPATTTNSSIFLYFKEGTTRNMPLENSCLGLPTPCKRNYFIFSEKDIAGSSGSATLNGAIFLANGSKITGSLPDAYIEFNADLYKDLTEAGIVKSTEGGDKDGEDDDNGNQVEDSYYIPSTSHLKVKKESQYANEENLAGSINARPAILVLPRVIYLTESDVTRISSGTSKLQDYYRVLYLNGAVKPNTENNPICPPGYLTSGAMDTPCTLTSQSAACNSSNLCSNHPFYVVLAISGSSSAGTSSSSSAIAESSSSSGTILLCDGSSLGYGGIEGTAITQPLLSCSDGSTPFNVTWSPVINWSNPVYGTYNNITATADCASSRLTSNSCGSLEVASNTTLSCTVQGRVKEGTAIPNANRTITCSNGVTATNITYSNINWNNPVANIYAGNIKVTADCGSVPNLQANCSGTLTVVGLTCTNNALYAKAGGIIPEPTLQCSDGSAISGTPSYTKTPTFTGWTIPSTAAAGTSYAISASSATCSGTPNVTGLTAGCQTVTVAGVTCTGLQSSVKQGGIIAAPTLSCNNGASPANRIFRNGSSNITLPFTVPSGAALGTIYNITATADCGTVSYLQGISASSCGSVTVSSCGYNPDWCGGVAFENVTKNVTSFGSAGCYFIKAAAGNPNVNQLSSTHLKINGVSTSGNDIHWTPSLLNSRPTVDGGYYIYIAPSPPWFSFTATSGAPECGGTTPSSSSAAASSSSSAGASSCEFNYATFCPDVIKSSADYSKITLPTAGQQQWQNLGGGWDAAKCIFVSEFTSFQAGANFIINGVSRSPGSVSGIAKTDGGFYVQVPRQQWTGSEAFTPASSLPSTCPGSGGSTPSSSSAAASSSSSASGGGGTAVCNGSGTSFGAGTHTVTVASTCSGGQFLCWGSDNIAKTVTFNGSARSGDALRYGNSGWVENWGNPSKPFTATLIVSAGTVTCRTDW